MDRYAVIKFVNYKTPTLERAERLSRYIRQLACAEPKYLVSQYMSPPTCESSLEVIENRWHPKGTRTFKQGILSFGGSTEELSPDKALSMTKEVLAYFTCYPWLASIHTNKPKHMHAHFLLGMTNVHNGKKYSQSPQELLRFKEHYNRLARKYSLPQLKGHCIPDEPLLPEMTSDGDQLSAEVKSQVEYGDQVSSVYCYPHLTVPRSSVSHVEMAPFSNALRTMGELFRKDFSKYFYRGCGKDDCYE